MGIGNASSTSFHSQNMFVHLVACIVPWRLTWSHRVTHLCNLGYTGAFFVHLFNKGAWLGQGPGQKNFVDNLFSVPSSFANSCPGQSLLL